MSEEVKMQLVHSVWMNPQPTDRHLRAQASWMHLYEDGAVPMQLTENDFVRFSTDIGDPRKLPYLKDILYLGLLRCEKPNDVVLWCNDDVTLDPRIGPYCASVVRMVDAVSMRRKEPNENPEKPHMGRELFAFTQKWLEKHLMEIPDFIIGCPCFDLVLAAFIRKQRSINTTLKNLSEDFYPCDCEHRYALHEPHPSSWMQGEHTFPANNYNRKLAQDWCKKNMPSLCL